MERDDASPALVAWSVQSIGGDVSLRAVSVPSDQVVWASGSKGTVIRTVDGGASWVRCAPADASMLDFRSLVAFDANRAVIATAGTPARIYRTEDGGASWRIAHEDAREGAFFDAMAFADEEQGHLVADPIDGSLPWMETRDGGSSWQPIPKPFLPTPHDGETMFAASCSCVLAREDDVVVVTGGTVPTPNVFVARSRLRESFVADAARWCIARRVLDRAGRRAWICRRRRRLPRGVARRRLGVLVGGRWRHVAQQHWLLGLPKRDCGVAGWNDLRGGGAWRHVRFARLRSLVFDRESHRVPRDCHQRNASRCGWF